MFCFICISRTFRVGKIYRYDQDKMAPLYYLVGIVSALVSGLGFEKLYTPAVITSYGFILNGLLSANYPGIMNGLDKCISLVFAIMLLIGYFISVTRMWNT
jgi:hypothetical protein